MGALTDEPSRRNEIAAALAAVGLGSGARDFEVEPLSTLAHSYVARVRFGGVEGQPASVIFKSSTVAATAGLAQREARFYRSVAPLLPAGLTARCLFAEESEHSATLLLEDLAATHHEGGGLSRTCEEARAYIEALADLHVTGSRIATLPTDWSRDIGSGTSDTVAGRLLSIGPLLSKFADAMGHTISATARDVIGRIQVGRRALIDFAQADQTILQGDAHYANALYAAGGAALLDWGNACIGPGETDLAHAVAMNLPRDVRLRWETPLLEAYQQRYAKGATPRPAEEFTRRYRLGVLYAVVVPIAHYAAGIPEPIWRRLLNNAVSAAEDHNAVSLLERS